MSHLSTLDKEAVRDSLQRQQESLLERIRAGLSEREQNQFAALLGRSTGDSSDEALAVTLGDLSAARQGMEMRRWRELEAAARRLDGPDFGICEECGAEIPVARLVANPGAVRCVACQESHERSHLGMEHGSL
jgi:DnaK suppressor protein